MKNLGLIVLFILIGSSCNTEKKSSNKKELKPKQTELTIARNQFLKDQITPFRKRIQKSINAFETFESYKAQVQEYQNLDTIKLQTLKKEFLDKYGQRSKSIKKDVSHLKADISELQTLIISQHKTVTPMIGRYETEAAIVKNCSESLTQSKKKLEKDVSLAQRDFKKRGKELKNRISKIKRLRKTIPRGETQFSPVKFYEKRIKKFAKVIKKANKNKKYKRFTKKEDQLWFPNNKQYVEATKYLRDTETFALKLIKESKKFKTVANKRSKTLKRESATCSKKNDKLLAFKILLDQEIDQLNQLVAQKEDKTNSLVNYLEVNSDFYVAYEEFRVQNDILQKNIENKFAKLKQDFQKNENELTKKYSTKYATIYSKLQAWISNTSIDGHESLNIIEFINNTGHSSNELTQIKEKMVFILQLALKESSRKPATIDLNIGKAAGSILGSATKAAFNVVNEATKPIKNISKELSNIKISVPKIKIVNIKLDLPKIKTPKIDIKTGAFKVDLPEIKIANISINKVIDYDFSDIEIAHLEIKTPEIDFISDLNDMISSSAENVIKSIKNFEIRIPKINIVNIQADVAKDIRNPMNIIHNGMDTVRIGLNNIVNTGTKAKEDFDREKNKFEEDVNREVNKGLKKVGKALEAAGQPENLARIAVVYAATISGGPLGAAAANALFDKLQNPGMSEEDMFKSFAIGAAAGYAANYVAGAPIESLQSMPNAASAVTRNLVTDAGEIILNGRNYSTEEFLLSVSTGAANLNSGDSMVSEVIDSAVNSGKDYALDHLIHKEKFDDEAFSNAIAKGVANGLTREVVHGLMDEYIAPHLPKDLDKKLFRNLEEMIFTTAQSEKIKQLEALEYLSSTEQEQVAEFLQQGQVEYFNYLAAMLNKPLEELTIDDLTNQDLVADFTTSGYMQEQAEVITALIDESRTINDPTYRSTASAIRLLPFALIALQTYAIYSDIENAKTILEDYQQSGLTPKEYALQNKAEIGAFGTGVMLSAIPSVKILSSMKNMTPGMIGKIAVCARKTGLFSGNKYKNLKANSSYETVKSFFRTLGKSDVPLPVKKNLVKSFDLKTIKKEIVNSDVYVYRWHNNDDVARKLGRFVSDSPITDKGAARRLLALPADNKMLHLDKFKIKNGTEIYRGKVAPLNGHAGGGSQIFITGENVEDILIPILD